MTEAQILKNFEKSFTEFQEYYKFLIENDRLTAAQKTIFKNLDASIVELFNFFELKISTLELDLLEIQYKISSVFKILKLTGFEDAFQFDPDYITFLVDWNKKNNPEAKKISNFTKEMLKQNYKTWKVDQIIENQVNNLEIETILEIKDDLKQEGEC